MPNTNSGELWRLYNPQYSYGGVSGGVPGQFGIPADVAPASLSRNVAAPLTQAPAGATMLRGGQVPRGTDQRVNPNAVMAVPPRQQLAQLMAPWQQQQQGFGRGPNLGSEGGGYGGGYKPLGNVNWGTLGNPAGWSMNPLDWASFRMPSASGGIGSNSGWGYNSQGMRSSATGAGGSHGTSAGGYSTSGRGW
jgi:hypothetical protein